MIKHIKIAAYPDSPKEAVKKLAPDRISIHTKELAEGNMANKRILEIVRSLYPGARIRMVSGHHAPHKIVSIE
jgi:uncharacterized protein YggU (UPF0235/DUF167 family)